MLWGISFLEKSIWLSVCFLYLDWYLFRLGKLISLILLNIYLDLTFSFTEVFIYLHCKRFSVLSLAFYWWDIPLRLLFNFLNCISIFSFSLGFIYWFYFYFPVLNCFLYFISLFVYVFVDFISLLIHVLLKNLEHIHKGNFHVLLLCSSYVEFLGAYCGGVKHKPT